jgi:endonuclease/exonuclease/phosphatase family metal-dependent hydrolase
MTEVGMIGPVAAPDVHVMTYNIRRRMAHLLPTGPDRWVDRKVLLRRILIAEQPTLLGVQEAMPDQVAAVADSLGSDYKWVGRGRNPDGGDEHCPIFYDTRRLTLVSWRQQSLSDTPDVPGSKSWGNQIRRVIVSAEFTDRATNARVLAFNTHFDHFSWRSRLASADFLLQLVNAARATDPAATIVVTGDFNANADSAVYRRLTESVALRDTWEAAAVRLTPQWGTFPNYRRVRVGGKRIDFILVGPGVAVASVGINVTRFDGKSPSDHDPVQAVLRPVGHDDESRSD